MLIGQDVLVAYERRQDDLALARKERLIRHIQGSSSYAVHYQRWLAQLGARLVSWGTYLQARYASREPACETQFC